MVKELDKIHDEAKKAIGFLAAEFKYAKEMQEHLVTLRKESTHVKEAIREADVMLKLYRWVARGERRVHRSDVKLEHLLDELEEILPSDLKSQAERFKTELKIADGHLSKFASFYRGEVKIELSEIEADEKKLRVLESVHSDKDAGVVRVRLKKELSDLEGDLNTLVTWIESNQAIVTQIDKWATDLERKA